MILLFEDFISEYKKHGYYSSISGDEFDIMFWTKTIDIEKRYVDILQNISDKIEVNHTKVSVVFNKKMSDYISIKVKGREISVFECNDEWFLVVVVVNEEGNNYYYKCDQIDGVLSILKNTINE